MRKQDIIVGSDYAVGRPQGFLFLHNAAVLRVGVAKPPISRSWRAIEAPATAADWPVGQGVLVAEHAPDGYYASKVVPLSHVHRPWHEHEVALAEHKAAAERVRLAQSDAQVALQAQNAALMAQAEALGLLTGDIWTPRESGGRYALTGEALSRLLEMAAAHPATPTTTPKV